MQSNAHYVFSIHIGVGIFKVAITNFQDEIIIDHVQHLDVETPALQVFDLMVQCVKLVLKESHIPEHSILGIGVGASGLVDFQTGINVFGSDIN